MLLSWKHLLKIVLLVFLAGSLGALNSLYAQSENTDTRDGGLEILLVHTHDVCYGANGEIRILFQSGTPPYNFQWSNGASSQDLYDTEPGFYEVTVTDGNGDQAIDTATINELPYLGSQIVVDVEQVKCHSGNDGSITTSFQNYTGPYSYVWSTGASTSFVNNISADVYTFTVTDAYDCQFDTVITIAEPDTIIVDVYTTEASCYGSMDGTAWVDVTGGVPPDTTPTGYEYNYHWPNNVQNDTINYYGGMHMMSVSDANNCVVQVPFYIEQPPAVYATPVGDRQICLGGETTLSSQLTGGTAPYHSYWINPSEQDTCFSTTWIVSPEQTTSYTFYAIDMNGCSSNVLTPTVNVYPEITINSVVLSADSICAGDPVEVEIDIQGGNGGPYQIMNTTTNQIVPSPFTMYPTMSETFELKVTDPCTTPAAYVSFDITVMPDPEIGFNVDKRSSCPPGVFYFNEFSLDVGQTYDWQFGDAEFSYDKNPVHIYTEDGVYDVALTVTSEFGCSVTQIKENLITIHPKPDAEFFVNSSTASILNPIIQFSNVSANADSIYWYFGDGDSTLYSHSNPWHEFEDIGYYTVKMVAENIHGCIDTTYKKIRIMDEYTFSAPNAFSPNNDGVNDCFRLCGHGVDAYEFHFYVFDRFGSIVYETKDFKNDLNCDACGEGSWDGTYNGSYVKGDELCEPGVYSWYVVYKDAAGVDNVSQGLVTLVR